MADEQEPGTPSPQPMKVVCFDFGGVLVEISRSWEEACTRAGLRELADHGRASSMLVASGHAAGFQRGETGFQEFLAEEARRLEGRFTEEQLREVHRHWLIGEVPGMDGVVDRLNAAGVLTASLSNTDAEHWPILREMGAIGSLAMQGLSFEMGLLKPEPGIFHEAELRFDASASTILFFDDLQENVDAATRCGWNAIRIDPHERVTPQVERGLAAFGVAI